MAQGKLNVEMSTAFDKAEAATRAQIALALKLNAEHFDGEGLANFPAILQALAQNYHAERLNAKVVK